MYSTCLFCNQDLGANEVVERFPVGRRLAFDAGKGRLWVVCRRCERWNLTPLEERWEAIEECERLYRDTRLRASTDNIGLARVREGLELVRIGAAQRPEMAAWRYGDQFGRRRTRNIARIGASAVFVAAYVAAGPMAGLLGGAAPVVALDGLNFVRQVHNRRRIRARVTDPETGEQFPLRRRHMPWVRLVPAGPDGWSMRLAVSDRPAIVEALMPVRSPRVWKPGIRNSDGMIEMELTGDAALAAARKILPAVNEKGARRKVVSDAVEVLSRHPDPGDLFARQAREHGLPTIITPNGGVPFSALPTAVSLALEMSAHEDVERRAMEGELAMLEAAWREAEEIAAISDGLLVPEAVERRLAAARRETNGQP